MPVDDTHQRASIIITTLVVLFAAIFFVSARIWVRCTPEEERRREGNTSYGTLLGLDDLLLVISMVSYRPG